MTDFLESIGLHAEGFTDQQIAQLDAIKPDIEFLANLVKTEMPRINRIVPVIAMAIAVYAQHQKEIGS